MKNAFMCAWLLLGTSLLATATHAKPSEHSYTLRFDDELLTLEVSAQLAHPGLVLSATHVAEHAITRLQNCQGETLARLRNNRLRLPAQASCFRYRVQLEAADPRFDLRGVRLVSPSRWMLLPRLSDVDTVRVHIEHAAKHKVSVPWRASAEGSYLFGASARSGDAMLAIGSFLQISLREYGLLKPVALLVDAGNPALAQWLTHSAAGFNRVFGRFPNPHAQILLVGASRYGSSPVPFGHVVRNQGETIRFFVDPQAELDELQYDWTAVHEIAHLLLPYVEQRWVSEGFASYYQNLMQAKVGRIQCCRSLGSAGAFVCTCHRVGAGGFTQRNRAGELRPSTHDDLLEWCFDCANGRCAAA